MKKGTEETGSLMIGIVISVAICIILGLVFYPIFFAEKVSNKENFESLVSLFKDISSENSYESEWPLYVHKDYVIVGFNGEDINLGRACYGWFIGGGDKLKIEKPKSCGSGGCLCLCNYKDSLVVGEEKKLNDYAIPIQTEYDAESKERLGVGVKPEKYISTFIFTDESICSGDNDICMDKDIDSLVFSGGEKCEIFFVPGIMRIRTADGYETKERGLDELFFTKEGNKISLKSIISS